MAIRCMSGMVLNPRDEKRDRSACFGTAPGTGGWAENAIAEPE